MYGSSVTEWEKYALSYETSPKAHYLCSSPRNPLHSTAPPPHPEVWRINALTCCAWRRLLNQDTVPYTVKVGDNYYSVSMRGFCHLCVPGRLIWSTRCAHIVLDFLMYWLEVNLYSVQLALWEKVKPWQRWAIGANWIAQVFPAVLWIAETANQHTAKQADSRTAQQTKNIRNWGQPGICHADSNDSNDSDKSERFDPVHWGGRLIHE